MVRQVSTATFVILSHLIMHCASTLQCDNTRSVYQRLSSVRDTIPTQAIHDPDLKICEFAGHKHKERKTCCTAQTEVQLEALAEKQFKEILKESVQTTRLEMTRHHNTLKNHLIEMVSVSHSGVENHIGSAFSISHDVNKKMFHDFYKALMDVVEYTRSENIIVNAFHELLEKLFLIVVKIGEGTQLKEFDEEYSSCLKRHIRTNDYSYFGSRITVLAQTLEQALLAISYLSQALDVATQTLNATEHLDVSTDCFRDLVKLNHCPNCYGQTQIRACRPFCEDIFTVCLDNVVRQEASWEIHMRFAKVLAEYLVQRVNVRVVVNAIDEELYDAINWALTSYSTYKSDIYQKCDGVPVYKRFSPSPQLPPTDRSLSATYGGDLRGDLRATSVAIELDFRGALGRLPLSICSLEPLLDQTGGDNCWDGLLDRSGRRHKLLEYSEDFAAYPEPDTGDLMQASKNWEKLQQEILDFLAPDRQSSDDSEGSGSDEAMDDTEGSGKQEYDDTEPEEPSSVENPTYKVDRTRTGSEPKGNDFSESTEIDIVELVTRKKNTVPTIPPNEDEEPNQITQNSSPVTIMKRITGPSISTTVAPKSKTASISGGPGISTYSFFVLLTATVFSSLHTSMH